MPYIDAVIKEALRLYDPASVLFRRALEDIIVNDNLVIPKVHHQHTCMSCRTSRAYDGRPTALCLMSE